jgi:hypothetical protein
MNMYNIYNQITIKVEGEGPAVNQLKSTLRAFENIEVQNPDLTISILSNYNPPVTAQILGSPEEYYSTNDGEFVFVKYGDPIMINNDFTRIRASSTAPPNFIRLIMEWRVRHELLNEGFSMIHASGVKYNEESIAFPAWRHTGKTNTMLTFLERGAHFLADDRLFIGSENMVRGYPTDLHILSYNYDSFPELTPRSPLSKIRGKVSNTLDRFTSQNSSIFSKGMNLANEVFVAEDDWFALEEVFPESSTIYETDLNKIVLLRTTTSDEPYILPIEGSELTDALCAINYYEWDRTLLEIGLNIRALTGDTAFEKSVRDVLRKQQKVFKSISDSVPIQMLCVPREEHWKPKTKQKIFEYVTE